MSSWRDVVDEAALRLQQLGLPDAETSARWIGRQATGTDATEWAEIENAGVTERQLAAFDSMLERRANGEPLQYVLGEWGFRSLDLMIDRRVLIPRPETEIVTEYALAEIDRVVGNDEAFANPNAQRPVVADLGTGSGAIGLAIASERQRTDVWLTDTSTDALEVARANLAGLGVAGGSVRLNHGSWFDALPEELQGQLAVVISNPPYVSSAQDLDPAVAQWEPPEALLAAEDGMVHVFELIEQSPHWLRPSGALVLEMAPDQVDRAAATAQKHFVEVSPFPDLTGRMRGIIGRWPVGGRSSAQ